MKSSSDKTGPLAAGAAALVVVAVTLAGRIAGRIGVTDPRVRVESRDAGVARGREAARAQRYEVVERAMKGEVATTAERLREATTIGAAAGLLLATELASGRAPTDADRLVAALLKERLLPAGFSRAPQSGTLATAHGTLAIRYRHAPAGVEVLSAGRGRESGPAILIRVPDDGSESGIWLAESLDEVLVPRSFAPSAEMLAAGWRPDAVPNLR